MLRRDLEQWEKVRFWKVTVGVHTVTGWLVTMSPVHVQNVPVAASWFGFDSSQIHPPTHWTLLGLELKLFGIAFLQNHGGWPSAEWCGELDRLQPLKILRLGQFGMLLNVLESARRSMTIRSSSSLSKENSVGGQGYWTLRISSEIHHSY